MKILWTKAYRLSHELGYFKIYVSQHSSGFFYAAVLHYIKRGSFAETKNMELKCELEQFIDNSEERAYQQCLEWTNKNLPGKFTIELEEHKIFGQ